jgi:hypothetical protein
LQVVCVGDGAVGDAEVCGGPEVGCEEEDGPAAVVGPPGAEECRAVWPGPAVGVPEAVAVGEAGAVAGELPEGLPPPGAEAAVPDEAGEAPSEMGAGGLPLSGGAGSVFPVGPPDRAATESIAAAPTTAITPMP